MGRVRANSNPTSARRRWSMTGPHGSGPLRLPAAHQASIDVHEGFYQSAGELIYYADRPRGCIVIRRRKGHAMKTVVLVVLALFGLSAPAADEVSTFRSYVDTDICAR